MLLPSPHAKAPQNKADDSVSTAQVSNAEKLAIKVSQLAQENAIKATAEKRAALWVQENAKAFECWNSYVEENGLPLAKHRGF